MIMIEGRPNNVLNLWSIPGNVKTFVRAHIYRIGVGLMAALGWAPAWSEVTHFDVLHKTSITAESSNRFKSTEAAEKFVAHATLELDPTDSRNSVIVDIDRAPRNTNGKIDFGADVVIVRPAKPNGLMLVEFPNRGSSQIFSLLNDVERRTGSEFAGGGNGYLLAKGYTLVIVGWQGDISPGQKIGATLPIAKDVSGFSRDEWVLPKTEGEAVLPLSWPVKDPSTAQLFERSSEDGPSTPVSSSKWHLVGDQVEISSLASQTSRVIYELRYIAKDSAIMGMGFAAVRDVALFLQHDSGPSNPLAANGHPIITHSILAGVSQSGRAVRDFLYLGFNSDANGKRFSMGCCRSFRVVGALLLTLGSPNLAEILVRKRISNIRLTSFPLRMTFKKTSNPAGPMGFCDAATRPKHAQRLWNLIPSMSFGGPVPV
jgi:hypothetical protein